MSRRIAFFALAATAVLIATPAFADRECFEDSCRLPEVVEPPQAVAAPPADDDAIPADEASAAAPKAAVVAAPVKLQPQTTAAAPVVREPSQSMKSIAEQANAPREQAAASREVVRYAPRIPKQIAPAPAPAPVQAAAQEIAPLPAAPIRSARVVSGGEPAYTGAVPNAVAPVVVVGPGGVYAVGRIQPYLFAPDAKIISVESEY